MAYMGVLPVGQHSRSPVGISRAILQGREVQGIVLWRAPLSAASLAVAPKRIYASYPDALAWYSVRGHAYLSNVTRDDVVCNTF